MILNLFLITLEEKDKRARIIFLVRDPKDVVSHYHQITKRSLKPLKFSCMSSLLETKSWASTELYTSIIYGSNKKLKSEIFN